jgi:hypothetical protein
MRHMITISHELQAQTMLQSSVLHRVWASVKTEMGSKGGPWRGAGIVAHLFLPPRLSTCITVVTSGDSASISVLQSNV